MTVTVPENLNYLGLAGKGYTGDNVPLAVDNSGALMVADQNYMLTYADTNGGYYGYLTRGGLWMIKRIRESGGILTIDFVRGGEGPNRSLLTTAWNNRENQTYKFYNE